jgi:hypothetical protein
MRGLDPRLHDAPPQRQAGSQQRFMDCRVKPGNDPPEVPAA